MKILMINNLYLPHIIGGAEKVVQLLAEGLREFEIDPIIVCTSPRPYIDRINGIKIYYLYPTNVYWPFGDGQHNSLLRILWHLIDICNPFMHQKVSMIIKEERPHLVHTHNLAGFSVGVWRAVKNFGLPLVHTLHDYYLLCAKSAMFNHNRVCANSCLPCSFFSRPKRALTSLVDQVVGISSFILQRHCRAGYFPDALKNVIYNPVRCQERKIKGSLKTPIRFGYIGRLNQAKGVETLLKQFIQINPPHATLQLAGAGEMSYVSFLRRRYAAPNIFFLGFMSPDDFYEQIDILIVPSLWEEPLGMVVLEAFSHGIPVIGARRGGISELIDEGKTGFLFEPTNPDDLVRIINFFLENPSIFDLMTSRCQAKSDEFQIDKIATNYSTLYKKLLFSYNYFIRGGVYSNE
jgi:glycosyltransferase involved in cell wall biosynthesis